MSRRDADTVPRVVAGDPQRIEKPWGYEVWWAHTDRYAGKLLFVNVGHSLSLQFHREKDECSYLLSGSLRLTQGQSADALSGREVKPGQCWRNEPGVVHSIKALEDSVVLEVSTPELEDVVRLQDRYGRSEDSQAITEGCAGSLAVADGVSLRLPSAADATELHELIEANRDYLARWLPWAASQTIEETLDFISKAQSQMTANDGFQVAITLDSRIIGMAGFPEVDWANRCTRIGYWLAEAYQGRGIATAAAEVLVEHALSVWDLNRVEIHCAEENRRSRAVAERLGFRQEGTLRQAEHIKSGYLDRVIYAMLREDWRARSSRPRSGL